MIKKKKIQSIEFLISLLSLNNNIYLVDTSGMNAQQIFEFRKYCYTYQVFLKVVKNTLLYKAMKSQKEKWKPFFSLIKGNTSIITSKVNNLPAKIIKDFRKKNNNEKPIFKAAYIGDSFYIGNDKINILINIKSREQLINDIINSLKSPLKNVLLTLKLKKYKILNLIQTLLKK